MKIKNATKQGYLEAYEGDGIDISSRMQYHRGTVQPGKAQTILANAGGGVIVSEIKKSKIIAGFGRQTEDGGFFRDKRIYEGDTATTTTTTTSSEMPYYSVDLRIRKLTPTECFRLMGLSDEDIAKLHGISDSTKYHLAGDSIVTTCLMAIFGEMLGIDWKEKVRGITNGWNTGTQRENDECEESD